jgi:hypothetical protein
MRVRAQLPLHHVYWLRRQSDSGHLRATLHAARAAGVDVVRTGALLRAAAARTAACVRYASATLRACSGELTWIRLCTHSTSVDVVFCCSSSGHA